MADFLGKRPPPSALKQKDTIQSDKYDELVDESSDADCEREEPSLERHHTERILSEESQSQRQIAAIQRKPVGSDQGQRRQQGRALVSLLRERTQERLDRQNRAPPVDDEDRSATQRAFVPLGFNVNQHREQSLAQLEGRYDAAPVDDEHSRATQQARMFADDPEFHRTQTLANLGEHSLAEQQAHMFADDPEFHRAQTLANLGEHSRTAQQARMFQNDPEYHKAHNLANFEERSRAEQQAHMFKDDPEFYRAQALANFEEHPLTSGERNRAPPADNRESRARQQRNHPHMTINQEDQMEWDLFRQRRDTDPRESI
ncbi:hypothetical protein SBOR_9819 [Sclerotinia borealis F-4128]|uniref:Uncharacterized protein n=1 Tax=Sclerotinia borealis (strain F-4128) TaxID=1432307 RepID=W9C5I6_SCLBF|nr:hypothetical protein SBOR_9819 [Sclerotinia borealis F-4128]